MITTLLSFALASALGHASEVAAGGGGFLDKLGDAPVGFSPTEPGHGTKSELPVTFVAGDAGQTPRGSCDLEARRGNSGQVLLSLVALKDPKAQFGFYDRKIVIPGNQYPLRTGAHIEQNDGGRTTIDYDGTTLTVRDYSTDEDGPSVTEYKITVDYLLKRVSHVTAGSFKGTKPVPEAETAAVGCDPALG